ncbi:MAG: glutamate-5-semialdehyde dehydrogenase [Eubacteriales bacterium]|nr:glutamate-5-semialdehyde dehydrogenase [Eubacteriales bacterium]MDD3882057.1 glutamate-5-semialdehyde dehydrogenase [Eubacteriales bacterium]MDD4512504.1 glutamate-5-semialdehyde dehydrogenase [Eubacteriales bacterium]
MDVTSAARNARTASTPLSSLSIEKRNAALAMIAESLNAEKEKIFAANAEDVKAAEKEKLAAPLLKRLYFGEEKLKGVTDGLYSLISLSDPIGITQSATELMEGLKLYRVSCPIGVIGIIFESRPDALVQISSLCLKSGNAVLLKGGREALRTNKAIADAILIASEKAGLPDGWLSLMESREDVSEMLKLDKYIDLIIPRGSNALVRYIMDNSSIPVMGHADGICNMYIDKSADLQMAVRLITDAKTQNVAVCNAIENLIVHAGIADSLLPSVKEALEEKRVEIRGDSRVREIISCKPADESDWDTEYLDYIISITIVDSEAEAISFINAHGSRHTDAIVASDSDAARLFTERVDSAGVYVNVSTRFADGFVYGLGAEVGISTSKLHARGPVGMEGLCSYKYKLIGSGQCMEDVKSGKTPLMQKKLDESCPL